MEPPLRTRRLTGALALGSALVLLGLAPAPSLADVSFGKGALQGETSVEPTSLQWGPDGRLYVAQLDGLIKAYTVQRNGASDYAVTQTETIGTVNGILNHDDNGTARPDLTTRLITGILVTGTAADPVIYASSSDPRAGGGPGPNSDGDVNLDTNSSVISRLTRKAGAWERFDVVRGLPHSEENHAANGLAIDPVTNTLYMAEGGNTNEGGPSPAFALLPEVAYSAAILSIDLDAIGNTTYDLPTLDDQDQVGADTTDPFGGNNGKNQAKLTTGSPVQVYEPGFRNPYDVVRTQDGHMFTVDNGANAGWGTSPVGSGTGGTCTNAEVPDTGTDAPDSLHLVTAGGYGGHPNPTRANTANTFNPTNPQSPVPAANPIECDYQPPGSVASDALATFPGSTDGLDEYTASNFGGAMQGDVLAAGYSSNRIFRVHRTADGSGVALTRTVASNVGISPLDLDATGDAGPFPGTIWIADLGDSNIYVLEPSAVSSCTGEVDPVDPTLDEDGDGFTNADEIDNGTSPCSAADVPPDADGDHISDLNDPDDDNDGEPDTSDPFAVDPQDGLGTAVPVTYSWASNALAGGLLELGFTGLMTNGTADYRQLFDPDQMTVRGAAGVLTLSAATAGDAANPGNDQGQAFQFGVDPRSVGGNWLEAHTRILSPFAGGQPTGHQSQGLFVGTGGQDDYIKVVAGARDGAVGLRVDREIAGALTEGDVQPLDLPLAGTGERSIDLYLVVDPTTSTVQAQYTVTAGGGTSARANVGGPVPIPASWLNDPAHALAVGIVATSRGGNPFPATWDFMTVTAVPGTAPSGGANGGAPLGDAIPELAGGSKSPVGGPPAFAAARLAGGQRILTVRRGRTTSVSIECPGQLAPRCEGRIGLETLRRYPGGRLSQRSAWAPVRLAGRSFSISSGRRARVTLTLTAAARRLLRTRRSVTARMTLRPTRPVVSHGTRSSIVTLRAP